MLSREKLDEIQIIISDLNTALNFKEKMDRDEPFIVLPFSDNSKVSITFDAVKKKQVDDKILALENLLKTKLSEIK